MPTINQREAKPFRVPIGSMTQSKQTHETIRKVLTDPKAPYAGKSMENFLQGSYPNDTNIYGDSGVDIVLSLKDAFGHDLSNLDEATRARFNKEYANATYAHAGSKKDVTDWLRKAYGAAVQPGSKAIYIEGDNNRRNADVCVS